MSRSQQRKLCEDIYSTACILGREGRVNPWMSLIYALGSRSNGIDTQVRDQHGHESISHQMVHRVESNGPKSENERVEIGETISR